MENTNEPFNQAPQTPTPKPRQNNRVVPIVIGIIILAALVYGFFQLDNGEKKNTDYKLSEINTLEADKQKQVLEDQLKVAQQEARNLPGDATPGAKYAAYIRLADLQNRLQKYNDAIASVDAIAQENQGNSRVWTTYATSYKGLGDTTKTIDTVRKALAIDDELAEPWRIYLEAAQDFPKAELDSLYVQALAKTKNNLEIVKSYARFLEKTGDNTKAVIYWETARNIDPNNAQEYDKEISRLRPPQQ